MDAGRPSLYTGYLRFLSMPFWEKARTLRLFICLLKSKWYYPRVFGAFGRGTLLHSPSLITHPRFISIGTRSLLLRGAHIEPIPEYAGIRYSPEISIGNDVYIGPNVYLICAGHMTIGDGTVFGPHVYMNDTSHGIDPNAGFVIKQKLVAPVDISIGKNCFLGMRSAILPGVTLGDHCVVGINSVVNRSFPAYSMVAGAPARLVKRYSPELKQWVKVGASATGNGN